MAQRRIGQEKLRLNHSDERRRSSLDEIDALIDWAPLALFKALLLAVSYLIFLT